MDGVKSVGQEPFEALDFHVDHKEPEKTADSVHFVGGARRSGKYSPFFLCPIEIVEAVAEARVEGDLKYEPGNWMKGGKEFFIDCLSHAIEHLFHFPNDASEDHLGHAACNISFMLWAVKRGIVTRADFVNAARIMKEELKVAVEGTSK